MRAPKLKKWTQEENYRVSAVFEKHKGKPDAFKKTAIELYDDGKNGSVRNLSQRHVNAFSIQQDGDDIDRKSLRKHIVYMQTKHLNHPLTDAEAIDLHGTFEPWL